MKSTSCGLCHFKTISLSKLKKVVYSLKNKCTSDVTLNVKLLKDLFGVVGYPLLYMVNTSIRTGKIPSKLKTSVIVPISKVSKPTKMCDFRPINLLSVIDKILEIIVCEQLREYFESNGLLYSGQSGFRNKHSCESALQYVCAVWRKNLSESKITLSVFVDLKRAFETIDRDILIKKLILYGLKDYALEWIKDFLTDRHHQTKVDNACSGKRVSRWGIPQGSVLGPLLFIIYVNDIHNVLKNSFVNLFADDTLISVSGKDFEQVTMSMNNELKMLYDWLCQNKLKLNNSKTKCMVIGSKANCRKFNNSGFSLNINGEIIDYVSEIKYLGIILDQQLNFSNHVSYMCKKIAKKIGFFSRISVGLSHWTRMLVYNTIILPHFSYGCSLLISCTKEEVQRLQIQQNKAMRILLSCDIYTPITVMLQSLGWLNIEQCIRRANLVLIYKIEHNLQPSYLKFYIEKRSNFYNYDLRTKQHFNIPMVNTTSLQKTLFYDGVRLYNELPDNIKNARDLKMFTKGLLNYLRN